MASQCRVVRVAHLGGGEGVTKRGGRSFGLWGFYSRRRERELVAAASSGRAHASPFLGPLIGGGPGWLTARVPYPRATDRRGRGRFKPTRATVARGPSSIGLNQRFSINSNLL
jgi:hypothetical protein